MGFADSLKKICDETGENIEDAVKATAMEMLSSVVKMSPVGNPDIWKANKGAAYMRQTHNLFVEAYNKDLGKGKNGRLRKASQKTLKATYKYSSGDDYVGGRFRGNWQIGLNTMNLDTSRPPDATGGSSISEGSTTLGYWQPGQTIYISNNLPYAMRLEYGWSTQAPGGMVRLTAQRFNTILNANIKAITSK